MIAVEWRWLIGMRSSLQHAFERCELIQKEWVRLNLEADKFTPSHRRTKRSEPRQQVQLTA